MFHEARKVGLEVVVQEKNVQLETCPQLYGVDDREDVTDYCFWGLFNSPLEFIGPEKRLAFHQQELDAVLGRLNAHFYLERSPDHFGQVVFRDGGL